MDTSVGLSWSGKGWFGVSLAEDTGCHCELYPTIWSAWRAQRAAEQLFIDIPIGLPDQRSGRRACDEAAKQLLGDRHPSVYYCPTREAIYSDSLSEAKRVNEPAGFSIQNQAWSLVPRIREVDEFLADTPDARGTLRETEPEVCYYAISGEPLLYPPTTDDGVAERKAIIESAAPELREALENALSTFTLPRFAPMVTSTRDVLDGFIAAITARRTADHATLPISPPADDRGLSMEIVYPSADRQLTLRDLSTASGGE